MEVKHMLIPYAGTPDDEELLRIACRIAKAIKAKVSIAYVLEVPMALPIDAENLPGVDEANEILDKAEEVALSTGVQAETDLLQGRDAGHAIVEEAIQRDVDLIFMVAHERTRLGMLTLGRTVEYILKKSPVPVWISRSAVQL